MAAILWFPRRLLREEEGQDLVEYALLIGFIALVAVIGAQVLGSGISGLFSALGNTIRAFPIPNPV